MRTDLIIDRVVQRDPHLSPLSPRDLRGVRLRAALLATLLLVLSIPAAAASAAEPKYGEEHRFGGFDKASGAEPGKFVSPVGFAVEPENPVTTEQNAVYVLDRTVSTTSTGTLDYRLQKLSSAPGHEDEVLGSATIAETYSDHVKFSDANPLISLAVDPAAHRVYALVEGIVEEGEGNFLPVAQRLVAWSTQPVGKKLEKASGFATEDPLTKAALVAGTSVLESSTTNGEVDLYAPEALTVDPANHDVVIEAQKGLFEGPIGGPTILQRVITEGPEAGKLGKSWVADKAKTAPNEEQGDGLFTAADGKSFGVDLFVKAGEISRLVKIQPNFEKPEPSIIAEDASKGKNKDEAPTLDNNATINYRSGRTNGRHGAGDFEAYTAGTPIAQLTNGLYAARYGRAVQNEPVPDEQSAIAPWSGAPGLTAFWMQDVSSIGGVSAKNIANEGIRLFEANGHVVSTIGGQALGHECNLDTEQIALAAGANGSLFALTQPNEANGNSDDQIIEFTPGGKGACPAPSGTVEVEGEEAKVKAGEPVPVATVHAGIKAKFDAISLDRAGETPYEFEWRFEGEGSVGPAVKVAKMESAGGYKWPTPEAEYEYTTPGVYEVILKLTGDYGTSAFPVKVKVLGTAPPVAKLECKPSSGSVILAGKTSVTCNASGSTPTPGSEIEDCHWKFGDGVEKDTQGGASGCPQVSHTFVKPGKPTVTLKITDEAKHSAEATQELTVAEPPPEQNHEESKEQPKTEEKPNTPIIAPPIIAVPIVKPVVKPLTNAQKLANALKACKKKPKRQRASCEKQAKKRYASKAKTKVKKKSAKKK